MALSKAKLKYLRALKQRKFRDQEKRFVAEGFRLVSEALSSDFTVELLVYTSDFVDNPEHTALIQGCGKQRIEAIEVHRRDLDSFADTVTSQGVAALVQQQEFSLEEVLESGQRKLPAASRVQRQVILALDAVSEPGNVGATIRTGDWFGVSGVLLGRGTVELYNPKVVRSTMGSLFHLPIVTDLELPETMTLLRKQGYRIYAATLDAKQAYDQVPLFKKAVLLVGNEARGLSEQLERCADYTVSIPRIGKAESLNVGIATGILLARFCGND